MAPSLSAPSLGAVALGAGLLLSAMVPVAARADQPNNQSVQERQVLDYGPGGGSKPAGGSILDSTNPIDLMNRIRRATALDESTPPGDAVDQALRALEAQSLASPSLVSPSASAPVLKAP